MALGDDEALLDVVTSANVACGFHAGDAPTMRRVCEQAAARGVAVGAQVGYRDLAGFGRRRIEVDPAELTDEVLYQVGALDAFARAAGTRVAYVKPHGALYNTAVHDEAQARAVVQAVLDHGGSLPVLGLPGSALLSAAETAGLPAVPEGFADRGVHPRGHPRPPQRDDALVTDPAAVASARCAMAVDSQVVAVDGSVVAVAVASLCVHGDTPAAVALARGVRDALAAAGVDVAPFTT